MMGLTVLCMLVPTPSFTKQVMVVPFNGKRVRLHHMSQQQPTKAHMSGKMQRSSAAF
jgi:hypothetical protein